MCVCICTRESIKCVHSLVVQACARVKSERRGGERRGWNVIVYGGGSNELSMWVVK